MQTYRDAYALKKHLDKTHGNGDEAIEDQNVEFDNGHDDGDDESDIGGLADDTDYVQDNEQLGVWDDLTEEEVTKRIAVFISKMKATSSIVQSGINMVVEESSSIMSDIVEMLKSKTTQFALQKNIDATDNDFSALMQTFETFQNVYQSLDTDYKQRKYFAQSGKFIAPEDKPIGVGFFPRKNPVTGHVDQVMKHITFQYIPLKQLLTSILQSRNYMAAISEYNPSDDGLLRDFHDGTFCKTHGFFSQPNRLKLLFYVDECEVVNPLGSKAGLHKVGVVYMTLMDIPPKYRSSLSNCFLVAIYNSGDLKSYGYDAILRPLVEDLKSLEREGLHISTDTFEGTIKASVAQVAGDNLGLNGLLGFVESFVGNHYCRHCRMHREEMQTASTECAPLLRSHDSYEANLLLQDPSSSGIKTSCLLNDLAHFHVTTNHAPDIMHDLLEGVCGLELHLVIDVLIRNGFFDLDTLNSRITSFDYGPLESKNKPSVLQETKLQRPDGASGQTAAQMWCLFRNFPLLIGDKVPVDNEHFELILLLLECMDIIFSPELSTGDTYFLKQIIKDHHSHFLYLFPDRRLKPKNHFMTHYPRQIRMLGPLIRYWTMRFEAKHSFFKRLGHIVCNFKNILKTLSYRQQMYLCHNLFTERSFVERDTEIGPGTSVLLASLPNANFLSTALEIPLHNEVFVANWCVVYGVKYCKSLLVITGMSEDEPQFQKIQYIICLQTGLKLITECWETRHYDRHSHSYCVQPSEELNWSIVSVDDLLFFQPLHAAKSYKPDDRLFYVSIPEDYSSNHESCAKSGNSSCPSPSTSDTSQCISVEQTIASQPTCSPPSKKFKADFSVKKYLEEHGQVGKDIIEEIEAGALSRRLRLEMVRILVAYMISNYGDRPKSHIKLAIAQSVVEDFPSLKDSEGEGYEAWYTSGTGRHSATGWLEERLRNVRRGPSRKPNLLPQSRKKKTSLTSTATLPEPDMELEEYDGMKEWLKHNIHPIAKVKEYMERTATMRAKLLRDSEKPLAVVIEEFPRLFDVPGMIETDFSLIFPEVAERLYLKWTPAFAVKVLRYASLQRSWARCLGVDEGKLDTDIKKVNISLQLLPAILPCGKKKQQLATVQTAISSFIDVQPIGTNIPQYLEKRITNKQPCMLILGDREEPQGIFVIAERKALPQSSLLKGVDVCFKLFYVLNLQYPWQSATTWEFFQKAIYSLGEANETTSSAVISMRASLNNVECS
ncbi:hypothetical protein HOLleu_10472 [Holothuria leucospilota]|uniref:Uncharacterized protein n=1 Tax=Holothuria leucospilota TaxID=206669 RepID=A0A9Q1CDM2_HOLLE|nr:hypothetical protein HOLleu_10472 [Holothuria leucospilota]